MSQERTVILNQFTSRRRRSKRTGKLGKARMTIEIEADPLLISLDPQDFTEGMAKAITEEIRKDMGAIKRQISAATQAKRRSAARNAGSRWVKRRYSGGRTGATPPDPSSSQWNNDSGRMREGLNVRWNKKAKAWTGNVPANRLDPQTFDDLSFRRYLVDLKREVRALNPAVVLSRPSVTKAISQATADAITSTQASIRAKRKQLARMGIRSIGRLATQVLAA